MIKALLYTAGGDFRDNVPLEEISELIHQKGNLLWLDLSAPTGDELAILKQEFGFHELAMEDTLKRHQRPKVDEYESFYFVVFYAFTPPGEKETIHPCEIHLFLGPNYLVTTHDGDVKQIDETVSRWRRNTQVIGHDIGVLVYSLLDTIVDGYFQIVDSLSEKVDTIEAQMFVLQGDEALQGIFALKRQLQEMRRLVAPGRDVVGVLSRRDIPIFPLKTLVYFRDIYDHLGRVTDSIDTYRDLLSSAVEVYLSTVSNRLNQVMKTLTVVTTILMTDALIAGVYGMNFRNMPELEWQYGYGFVLGLMVVVALALATFFRIKKWL